MGKLKPLKLLPARKKVASELRRAILSNSFKEGQELSLESVAKQLGVSITPVREAFQILDSEGLIKLRPNKGAIVLGINIKKIKERFEMRAALESEAVAIICRNKLDISKIINVHEVAMTHNLEGNTSDYSDLNQAFHLSIWESCKNQLLKESVENLWNGLSLSINTSLEQYMDISIKEHDAIVHYLKNHDEINARNAMSSHIYRSMNDILTHFEQL